MYVFVFWVTFHKDSSYAGSTQSKYFFHIVLIEFDGKAAEK